MPAERVRSQSPWHLVLVLDDSKSMEGAPAEHVNNAVQMLISELKVLSGGSKPYFKLSVIQFGSRPNVLVEAVNEQGVDARQLSSLDGSSGGTDAAAALRETYGLLSRHPGVATDFTPFVFFLSDGAPDDSIAALEAGRMLKALDIPAGMPRIITIGFGDANDAFMSQLASSPELYKRLKSPQDIGKFLPAIGTRITPRIATGAAAIEKAIANY